MKLINLPDRQSYVLAGFKTLKFKSKSNFVRKNNYFAEVYHDEKNNLLISNDIEIQGCRLIAREPETRNNEHSPIVQNYILFNYNSCYQSKDKEFKISLLRIILQDENFNNIKRNNEQFFNIITDTLDNQIFNKKSFKSFLLSVIEIVMENTYNDIDVSFIDEESSQFKCVLTKIMTNFKFFENYKIKFPHLKSKLFIYQDNEKLLRRKFQNSYRLLIDKINNLMKDNDYVLILSRMKVSFLEYSIAQFANKKLRQCPLKSIISDMKRNRIRLICEKSFCNRFNLLLFRKLPNMNISSQIIFPIESSNISLWLKELQDNFKKCYSLPNGHNIWIIDNDFHRNGFLGIYFILVSTHFTCIALKIVISRCYFKN